MSAYTFFIAGIIQGSIAEGVHPQDYRVEIKSIIERYLRGSKVYCPFENHPNSLSYDDEKAQRVFFDHLEMVKKVDCLVTYLPEASMGTAAEMYAAREASRAVVTVSPLTSNWTVKFLSHKVLPGLEEFKRFASSGELAAFLQRFYERDK